MRGDEVRTFMTVEEVGESGTESSLGVYKIVKQLN